MIKKLLGLTCFPLVIGGCAAAATTDVAKPATRPAPVPTEWMPQPAMLIYSETAGWRHEEGISGGNVALMQIAADKGMGYFTTQHAEIFNTDSLARFDLVVFNSATGDSLSADQKSAFQTWLENDGSAILIHGSLDGSQKDWTWYQQELVGPLFISHPMAPQFQEAEIEILATGHPVVAGLPDRFTATDEWYTFDGIPDEKFTVLAGLDETTYSPRNTVYGVEDLRMGDQPEDHPIVWSRCLAPETSGGGGRVVSTALGHTIESFGGEHHRILLSNAIDWTMKAGSDQVGC